MSIMVNMNMNTNTDLYGQIDSDEKKNLKEKDFIRQTLHAGLIYALFHIVCHIRTHYNVTLPPIVPKTLSLPTSDNYVHPRKRAHWTIFEEAVLIQFLFERKNKMISRTTFKDTVFKRAAKTLNRFHEQGARKTSTSCRSKWTRVCTVFTFVHVLPVILTCMTS